MAQAAEDHRASAGHEPRSIYGKIVAEADRLINPEKVIKRTIQYGHENYPELGKEAQYQRFRAHMMEKYADGGYLKLWLPESENAAQLEILRQIIRDEQKLRETFEKLRKTSLEDFVNYRKTIFKDIKELKEAIKIIGESFAELLQANGISVNELPGKSKGIFTFFNKLKNYDGSSRNSSTSLIKYFAIGKKISTKVATKQIV